jgi:hypothetical protein
MNLQLTRPMADEGFPTVGDWVRAGCLVGVATGVACMWAPWISIQTADFGDIRQTDGWGQGLHGCDHVFTHTCNPDPVPTTAHVTVVCAIAAGCGILLWMVARRAYVAGLVAVASLAAAAFAAVTYAGFDQFFSDNVDQAPHLTSISIHVGFGATMAGFLAAAGLAGYSTVAQLKQRLSAGTG